MVNYLYYTLVAPARAVIRIRPRPACDGCIWLLYIAVDNYPIFNDISFNLMLTHMRIFLAIVICTVISCITENNDYNSGSPIQLDELIGTWIGTHREIQSCTDQSGNEIADTAILESRYRILSDTISICRGDVISTKCATVPLSICDLPGHIHSIWKLQGDSLYVYKIALVVNGQDTSISNTLKVSRVASNKMIFSSALFTDTCERQ